ncbi:MAG: DUF2076 domain-containing protein [Geminicoccaceae bacterium]|nr:DUF2076 domain-containing protein [Geminicoccaceae bacterium]
MTPEDRQAISSFFDRLAALRNERDPDAEKLIGELMERHPHTKYYVTQMAFFLEQAFAEAQNRIRELEYELEQRRAGSGLFGGLFGGGRATPPPEPVHAPGYRPGMFAQPGGFLGGAMATVAGIAGGMMLGSLLASLFGGPAEAATGSEQGEDETSEEPDLAGEEEEW